MIQFPEDFAVYTQRLFGDERWQRYLAAFEEVLPVSVRLNPFKKPLNPSAGENAFQVEGSAAVPWCRNAFYLSERPNFTLDPLLHAGAYYVQEASSMFLDQILRQYVAEPVRMLDLCAAPGGKSTLARAALPEGSLLVSNEPDRRRANILAENLLKQGHPEVVVTNNFPRDYRKMGLLFDVILTDVPCSGEGMFRKDAATIEEWSIHNVMKCAELQRSIVSEIWECLKPGGLLVYSTCTFNVREDEENVRWIMEELGADILTVEVKEEWGITGSLLEGWNEPVYRFIPGISKGEGMFMAVLRKSGSSAPFNNKEIASASVKDAFARNLRVLSGCNSKETSIKKHPQKKPERKVLNIPSHSESLLINLDKEKYPMVELTREDALRYLHHEALRLPETTPKGYTIVTYQGLPLGFVKNIGSRANNLYPAEWKIRNI